MACRQEYGRRGCSSKTLNVRSTVIVGLAVVIELAVRGLLRNIRPCGVWAMICDALLVSLWVAIGGLERSSEMKCISMLELGWVCISLSLKMPLHHLSLICARSSTNSLHQSPDTLIEADTTRPISCRILNTRAGAVHIKDTYSLYYDPRLNIIAAKHVHYS